MSGIAKKLSLAFGEVVEKFQIKNLKILSAACIFMQNVPVFAGL